ncbi:COG5654 Uncharacterized conserved protein [Methylophilaceae bacterium]
MLEGGRWNTANVPVIYAGMTIEIASFEKLVHVMSVLPKDLVLVNITMPNNEAIYYKVQMDDLPVNWNALPSSAAAQEFGNQFIQDNQYLGMIVPSVVIPEARNIVINPNHPQWANCTMSIERDFVYDARLAKIPKKTEA